MDSNRQNFGGVMIVRPETTQPPVVAHPNPKALEELREAAAILRTLVKSVTPSVNAIRLASEHLQRALSMLG